MCCHAIFTIICGKYFSDLIPAAPQPHHCTKTFLTGGPSFGLGRGGGRVFPLSDFRILSFRVLSSRPCPCQLLVFNASSCCLWPFHLSLCCFFKAMLLVGILPQQGLINRLMSHQHVQIWILMWVAFTALYSLNLPNKSLKNTTV